MLKRKMNLAIIMAVIAAVLICQAGASAQQEKIELRFFHAMKGNRGKVLNELIDRFNKENPDITVEGVQITSKSVRMGNDYNALYNAILENTAKKTPPDIAQVYENWTVQLIGIDAIIAVEDYLGTEITNETLKDLVPVFRQANNFQGKLWTLPFNKSIYVLYYNKDIFKKAGVKPPETWEELKETARVLTQAKGDEISRYGIALNPSVDMFGHYLYSFGGEFINDDKAVFDCPVGEKDLNYWVEMVHQDKSALLSFTDRKEYLEGRSAMYIDTTSRIQSFKEKADFKWGVAMLPRGNTRKLQFAGTNLAVFSHLSPKKRTAALKFLDYMTSREATLHWAVNTGYLPVRVSAINSKEYQNLLEQDPRYKVAITSLEYAVVQPKVAGWEMIRGIINDAMYDAISLRFTPDQALNRAVDMSNQILKNLSGNF
ncbi:MAG: ABC transporter substrate-binding protein [Vulcanimicrobiota bacterium]